MRRDSNRPSETNSIIRVLNNPIKDHLIVNVPEAGMAELYNIAGQLVMQLKLKAGDNTIHTSQLSAGTYLLKYQDATAKVIRE